MKPVLLLLTAYGIAIAPLCALDPSEVDGTVVVTVETADPVWKVTVQNLSKEALRYEMLRGVPRGLAIECWDDDKGFRVHAGDLAKYLYLDGFPGDIRTIEPGKEESFSLDPSSVSSTDSEDLKAWKRELRLGFARCRVAFGRYGSQLFKLTRPKKANKS